MPPTRTEPTPAGKAWHPFKKQRSKIMRMNREEDDEEVEPQPQPLTVQRLKGAVPPSQVPCAHAVDHENQIVFFNTFEDDTTNGSEIFACTLETGIWKNVTEKIQYQSLVGAREKEKQLPSRFGGGMALYKVKVSESRTQTILLLFGGRFIGHNGGGISNEILAIDVEKRRWWVVDFAGEKVMPRVESQLVVVGNQLFIFGGKNDRFSGHNHFHSAQNNTNWPWINSYSVAKLQNNQWSWEARDVPLPAEVQVIGVCNAAAAMKDGNKILLTFVPIHFDYSAIDMEVHTSYRLKASSFVVFDVALRTFTIRAEGLGTFPGRTSWHTLDGLPVGQGHRPSAIVCNFHTDPARHPELFIYSLAPQPTCKSLALRQRIAATKGIVFELFVVVGSKRFLFGWTKNSKDEWDVLAEIPRQ